MGIRCRSCFGSGSLSPFVCRYFVGAQLVGVGRRAHSQPSVPGASNAATATRVHFVVIVVVLSSCRQTRMQPDRRLLSLAARIVEFALFLPLLLLLEPLQRG